MHFDNMFVYPSWAYHLPSHGLLTKVTVTDVTSFLCKSDPRVAGCSHDLHATIAPVGTSCLEGHFVARSVCK